MFSVLNFPGPVHAPHRGGYRPRRPCATPCPPHWLAFRPGKPHHVFHQRPFYQPSALEEIVDLWKNLTGLKQCEKKTTRHKPDWTEHVNCEGFSQDDIKVTVSDGKLIVEGSYELSDGKGSLEVRQMKKTIVVPDDVDSQSITVTLDRSGTLNLSAPRKPDEPGSKDTAMEFTSGETNTEKASDGCEDSELSNVNESEDRSNCQCPDVKCTDKPCEEKEHGQDDAHTVTCEAQMTEETSMEDHTDQTSEEVAQITKETNTEENVQGAVQVTKGQSVEDQPGHTSQDDQAEPMWEESNGTADKNTTETTKDIEVKTEKEFRLEVDVTHLNPDSIEVTLTPEGLMVSGTRHVTDTENGRITVNQHLMRRFTVPAGVNTDLLTSTLSSQGQLTIRAPYRITENTEGTVIPITHS